MKSAAYFITVCIILMLGCTQHQSDFENDENAVLREKLDEYFTALTGLRKFNGVIYVARDGKVVIHKAYNLNTDTLSSLYVTEGSQFDIHSVSKTMAQSLLLQLEKEGKILPQDRLNKFVPDFPRGKDITIQMLLGHRSGLPREFTNYKGRLIDLDTEQIVDLAKEEPLIFEPGEEAQYSNIGYQLIYYVIGKVNDSTFEEYLESHLFIPLGMNNSGAHFYGRQRNISNLAANHELDDDTIVQVDNILEDEFKQARIYSTAGDLGLMLEAFQNDPGSIKLAKDSVIQHSGGSDGVRAHIYADLRTKTNFVLLCNYDAIPFERTIKDLALIIEGGTYDIPQALNRESVILDPAILNQYIGKYEFADMNDLKLLVKVEDGKLTVYQEGEKIAVLLAENDSTFFEDPKEAESFEFITNQQGSHDVLMGWKGIKLKGTRK